MANGGRETHRHFILEGVTETERYRSRGGGSSRVVIPQEDRPEHAARLQAGLSNVRAAADRLALEAEEPVEGLGIQVEFEGFPDLELAFEKLPHEGKGIELRNVRVRGKTTFGERVRPNGQARPLREADPGLPRVQAQQERGPHRQPEAPRHDSGHPDRKCASTLDGRRGGNARGRGTILV